MTFSNQKSAIKNQKSIYLDYNATAPMHPLVKEAMFELMGEPLNASSIHAQGRRARKIVEDARKAILGFVNGDQLVFCGSATEANNLALGQFEGVVISAIEHDSVYKTRNKIGEVKVLESGVIDVEDLKKLLSTRKNFPSINYLVSVMLANNETGVIQPIKEIADIVHAHNGVLHCDAVQAFGKIDLDFKELGVDMMTISSHKIGGPLGASALVYKTGLEIKPSGFGGGQEKNRRAGTENVAAIHGFAASTHPQVVKVSRETQPINVLECKIKALGGITIAENSPRLPNTSCIIMPGTTAAIQIMHFDLNNIMVSSGSACSSGKVEVSRVLQNMGIEKANQAIRVSTGWGTTVEVIERFFEVWEKLYLKQKS